MKIAAFTRDGVIAETLRDTKTVLIVEVEDKEPKSKEELDVEGQEMASVLLKLAVKNIDVVLANEMSTVLQGTLNMLGISLYPGCKGDVNEQIAAYLLGEDVGDPSKLSIPEEDENDPMACMHDCSRCMAECSSKSISELNLEKKS